MYAPTYFTITIEPVQGIATEEPVLCLVYEDQAHGNERVVRWLSDKHLDGYCERNARNLVHNLVQRARDEYGRSVHFDVLVHDSVYLADGWDQERLTRFIAEATQPLRATDVEKALEVIVRDARIRTWLRYNDPQALRQACDALRLDADVLDEQEAERQAGLTDEQIDLLANVNEDE